MVQTPDGQMSVSESPNRGAAGSGSGSGAGGALGVGGSATGSATTAPGPDPEVLSERLMDDKVDVRTKLQVVVEVKEMLEMFHSVDYGRFLKSFIPAYTKLLENVPCAFSTDATEQRLRHTVLETIQRLPQHELVKEYAEQVMKCMMVTLQNDNEDNAVTALKIIIDLHRSYKQVLGEHVQPFLDLVQTFYKGMGKTVQESFGDEVGEDANMQAPGPSSDAASASGSTPGPANDAALGGPPGPKTLLKSTSSFKVLTECPIAIVLIFQSYRQVVAQAIGIFVPLVVEHCLHHQAKPQADAHAAAAAKGEIFVGVAPSIKKRALYSDMIVAQVKAMSFIAYVLRGTMPVVKPYAQTLPDISVRLLKDCPPEAASTRKELLVATRHVLSTDYRQYFIHQIDTLLDERVLLGTGISSYETQRPLAISMLADLVHHVRAELKPAQLVRVIEAHATVLHDPSLAPSIQTMCVKLLLNLVETIVNKTTETGDAPRLLHAILETFVEKLAGLSRLREDLDLSRAMRKEQALQQQQHKDEQDKTAAMQRQGAQPEGKGKEKERKNAEKTGEELTGASKAVEPTSKNPLNAIAFERAKPIQAAAMMIDLLSDPLKDARFLFRNVMIGVKTLIPVLKHRARVELNGELISRLFVDGVRCWSLHDGRDGKEERELMEVFTSIFIELEPQVFHEVFSTHLGFLFDQILITPSLLGIPQSLLSNELTSKRFVSVLLRFVIDRLDQVGTTDKKYASVSLRLFKMAFMAVTIFPEENEVMLQPHLSHLIMTSMKLASRAPEPTNYFLLLRALFRSIGGGRFELLYKDVLPLLPVLLESLNNLLQAAEPSKREIFVDLCLTVPVRLSVLLPYLGYLMRPLVLALLSSTELVSQGLRTLELCIDNLTPEFLDPIMAPHAHDLMNALWKHLQPLPHNHQHSHTTMRILGKMGGRNRKMLQAAPKLQYHSNPSKMRTLTIHFDGSAQKVPWAPILDLALENIRTGDAYHKKHAFEALKCAAAAIVDDPTTERDREETLERVVKGLFQATLLEDVRVEAEEFIFSLCRHIFVLEAERPFPSTLLPSPRQLIPLVASLLEGLVIALAHADPSELTHYAELQLKIIFAAKETIEKHQKPNSPRGDLWAIMMHALASRYCTQCYNQLWSRKTGGWVGIDMLVRKANLGSIWVREHQLEIIRALLFMLKDMPGDPPGNSDDVGDTLVHVLEIANARQKSLEDTEVSADADAMEVEASTGTADIPPAEVAKTDGKSANSESGPVSKADKKPEDGKKDDASQPDNDKEDEDTKKGKEHVAQRKGEPLKDGNIEMADGMKKEKDGSASIGNASASQTSAPASTPQVPLAKRPLTAEEQEKILVERQFSFLVGILVQELSSANELVRTVTQRAFRLLAKVRGCSATDILAPVRDRLLGPIFSKPLRALPFGMQIGHIDAITFCLQLDPPLPEFNEELYRVLTEALALADAEDAALIGRTSQYKNMLAVTNLRVASIRLLSSALACNDFLTTKQAQMRMKIISVYFKSLYSRSEAVVEVAHAALKSTLQSQSKLPKDVLQSGLRPILMTLADPSRLTTAGLDGLARLLELLTSYFKVEIGTKLLSHMATIADPAVLERASAGALEAPQYVDAHHLLRVEKRESEPIEILAAITRIFHLLPATAFMYMEKLTEEVCKIESKIRRVGPTPFTKPLTQFFEKFPVQAVQHLFSRINDPAHVRCFKLALSTDFAVRLRAEVVNTKEKYLRPLFGEDADAGKVIVALQLIQQLIKVDPAWLIKNEDVQKAVLRHWISAPCARRRRHETLTGDRRSKESVLLIDVLCSYLKEKHDLDTYFALTDVFTYKNAYDLTPLTRFLYERFANSDDTSFKRDALLRFLQVFESKGVSQVYKTQTLRTLINPMLLATLRPSDARAAEQSEDTVDTSKAEEEALINQAVMSQILNRVWRLFQSGPVVPDICYDDALRIELLHMSTTILGNASHLLGSQGNARKDTIKFGWANISSEDLMVKNAAYIFISKFIESFESPLKIVGQVYIGLLRSHQSEGRAMVRRALDILVPALPKRVGTADGGQPPQWAKWTKRILTEEGHNSSQLFLLLQLIVRHSNLFYSSREIFLPYVVNNLAKLGLAATASQESRLLTIELVDVIITWQSKRDEAVEAVHEGREKPISDESASRKRSEDPEEGGGPRKKTKLSRTGAAGQVTWPLLGEHAYSIPNNLREMIVGFLVRFISISAEPIARGGVIAKAFTLFKDVLKTPVWSDVQIKLTVFQRPLVATDIDEAHATIVGNALQTLRQVVKDKDETWFLAHMAQLQRLLEKSIASSDPALLEYARPILEKAFQVIPDNPPSDEDAEGDEDGEIGATAGTSPPTENGPRDDASAFRLLAETAIAEGLRTSTNLYSVFVLLATWSQRKPDIIEAHLQGLVKALTKLTKEHLAATETVQPTDPGLKLLMMVLELLRIRISTLGEQRRWFLSAVVQLVERSRSLELCRFLLDMMSKWTLEQKEAFPTIKEKAGILVKMMSFGTRDNDPLLRDYLELIHSIYENPAFARSELTVRLENAFLMGCKHKDPLLRQRFISIFDRTLVKPIHGRLQYLLGSQSWESLAEYYWMSQILDLTLGSISKDRSLLSGSGIRGDSTYGSLTKSFTVGSIIRPVRALLYTDSHAAHGLWVLFFKAAWRTLPRKHQEELSRALVGLLSREYHIQQASARPNIVQTLITGALACAPQPELPPHVVKYLGRTFNVWHSSAEVLQDLLASLPQDDDSVREATQDALAELYSELSEDDMFYGLWRRRCVYAETNAAISFEQNGMWAQAQVMYEQAQIKARAGVLNFTEAEYSLWEDHWVLCAQKLQQWDVLTELAKLEGDHDMLLECAWRLSDWTVEREILEQALDSLSVSATPRRRVFEAYMALLKSHSGQDKLSEFGRICDEAIQLTLRKWHSLPAQVTQAHVPLLQVFQQFVELQEASTVFSSLAVTNATNLDQRSAELKTLMQTWRERLPNLWDDINAWSDLVAWRQHVFGAVNRAYLPLVPLIQQQSGAAGSSTNSYAYRGYHETAWIINRFAHVARKHYLNDVCISSLTKIYTLPNIEIQEAFLKLREQAKSHFQQNNPNELAQGLEVINNTNLMFFGAPQKAEFFTLKGMFMAKLGLTEEANSAFSTAIQMDLYVAKAWTEWGRFNDRTFRDKPGDTFCAVNAVSCYLQAAGLYKNSKVRKILIRVLWLLGCDDASGNVNLAIETFRGDTPIWYWITFIPQLLQALSHKESRYARRLLLQIAKAFPQSLYFYLRTSKEDFAVIKRSTLMQAQRAAAQARQQQEQQNKEQQNKAEKSKVPDPQPAQSQNGTADGTKKDVASSAASTATDRKAADSQGANKGGDSGSASQSNAPSNGQKAAGSAEAKEQPAQSEAAKSETSSNSANGANQSNSASGANGQNTVSMSSASTPQPASSRQPWEYVDETLQVLKTSFPLLALTMENMAEQIQQRFKPSNDEDIYRLTTALLNDALQQYIARATLPNDSGQLPKVSVDNVIRFAENLPPGNLKQSFEEDFVKSKPTLRDYVQKLQRWRDRYEEVLDKRTSKQHLEHCSHFLVEFQHQKFDDIEVPGQYLKLEDNNSDFVKIARFEPTFELIRSSGICTRRITILSHKGSLHSFAIQLPSARYCRREERILQLLRCLNRVLEKRKETRRRGLLFNTPAAIPFSPQLRLLESDCSLLSLQDIYERHCEDFGMGKDDPIMAWAEKMRSTWSAGKSMVEFTNLRMELLDEISTKMVPETVLTRFMIRSMKSPSDLWLMRKHFTLQMASAMFLTYVLFVSSRLPSRIHISRASGAVVMSDLVPTLNPSAPQFKSPDATPFRLTPNIQHFIGPIGIEGLLTASLVAIGRTLSEPEREFEEYLSIFVRDEINFWLAGMQRQPPGSPNVTDAPREVVYQNILEVVKRGRLLSCKYEIEKNTQHGPSTTPVSQTVLDLINSASNPSKLALQEPNWAAWL
ncbi:hypothetical protein K437DRAFT_79486 [Tilletiaria anomala UBC 951]|uniref:Non-specific serine/threonine protein kinase n=1 Tax=Tilletiaria anomala (strain ATCC 24038 / CBS 436.72 / UBC 951) TaxID=1037660 RepID=A0A066WEN0_TILAU|nr:uncharacterized protein K437DRAFT_79486 [Tilletiaria anomala UBC 951]KDN49215.1 hypothetical protein K437DRAFT_79486 [Tilletiaria anomala UBC 951]